MKQRDSIILFLLATHSLAFTHTSRADQTGFAWQQEQTEHVDLTWNGRPALRYVMPNYDDSTPERRAATYKPFHHLYSPDGKTLLTKGTGGLYPHHRGIFYGFSRIRYGDSKSCDTWHCNSKACLSADGVLQFMGVKQDSSKKGNVRGRGQPLRADRLAWRRG